MNTRYVCIHGHFYQPPRENPWTGKVERQPSAAPFHDWNERITQECYGPNSSAQIYDAQDRVRRINNYSRISFNFGPTLLSWMQDQAPTVYRRILDGDRESEKFFGHGSAMAQAYNHMILPLAGERDKTTQVRWGLKDFQFRFGRAARGLWLPECAVDFDTLRVLAEEDVAFTVLSPGQCKRVRPDGGQWTSDGVDTRRAYRVDVGGGKSVAVFFYDGPLSQGVAFEGALNDGDRFADRLLNSSAEDGLESPLTHIATDGESYGHHHRFGEMALARALERLECAEGVRLTNYASYLAQHSPTWEAEIFGPSAWSCAHGVERWRSHCGCSDGGAAARQDWRAPLRSSLDALKLRIDEVFEAEGAAILSSPWDARNDYIQVLLDSSQDSAERFLNDRMNGSSDSPRRERARLLLEMQRYAMLMFTSCGWFFDDIGRIETRQILCYAARAIQLGRECVGADWEPEFVKGLSEAESNTPEQGNGARIYRCAVESAQAPT